ncbi:hypothetical protein GGR53DRAFT_241352 [Hypoxylon sp. FL1150]|nr:hypothetical protein GGR53DRAFT_241352 [Hypoxylon sp. FL1150]
MAHPRCLSHASPARALHRVLVSDLASHSSTQHAVTYYYLFPPRLFSSSRLLPGTPSVTSTTPLSAVSTAHRGIRALTTTPPLRRILDAFQGRITNDRIPYKWIRIASPPPESKLSPPRRIDSVLASLDPKKHTLVMVAPPPTPSEEDDSGSSSNSSLAGPLAAICRVVDNAAASAAALEAQKQARRKAVDSKELELSWSIAGHDLAHKLRRLRDFLSKGLSVEVTLAKKKGGRVATRDEAAAVLAAVKEAAGEVGAKEARKMEGWVGGAAKLFLEGVGERKKRRKQEEVQGDAAE